MTNETYEPWVPDGAYEPKVGDRVRFRMGERVPISCPNCEMDLLALGNELAEQFRLFDTKIRMVFPAERDVRCLWGKGCGSIYSTVDVDMGPFRFVVALPEETTIGGWRVAGFTAAAIELTPLDAEPRGGRVPNDESLPPTTPRAITIEWPMLPPEEQL